MIWIVFALLTALAAVSVLWPLARSRAARTAADADRAFYDAQIAEIARDVERGLISPAQAETARAEAGRRLIARAKDDADARQPLRSRAALAAILASLALPAIALPLYLRLGAPDLPDAPLQARLTGNPGPRDVFAALARLERYLQDKPDDARGWEVIAPVYLRLGRPGDAARAWANAVRAGGPTADRFTSLGEALVYESQGKVTPAALAAFERAHELDKTNAQARFFIGLAAEQAGDKARAREQWTKLLDESPADAPWAPMVRARLQALGAPVNPPVTAPAVAPPGAPATDAGAAIAGLPPDQQGAAIRAMVERLDARLRRDGADSEGWLRLIRAYTVLKDGDKARAALADARKAAGEDGAKLDALKKTAVELGLETP